MCLLNWKPYQNSSIHNHPKGGCFFNANEWLSI